MVTQILVPIRKVQSNDSTSNISSRNGSNEIKLDKHLLGSSLRDLESNIKALRISPDDWSVTIECQIKKSSRSSMNLLELNNVEILIGAANVESRVLTSNGSSIKSDVVSCPSINFSTLLPIRSESRLGEGNGEEDKEESKDGLHWDSWGW